MPCYDLTFNDGTHVICSEDQQWLTCHGGGANWMLTKKLVVRDNQGSNVVNPLSVWDTYNSREAGYLADAFDGEGCPCSEKLRQIS